jgi:hypothetical protein
MKKNRTLTFLLFFCVLTVVQAQKYSSPFKAGATLGINMTQIDGDDQFGYNRRGLNFGLRGAVILRKNMDISTELLYSERGTEPNETEKARNKRTTIIALQYAEVPLLFNYYHNKADDGHYRWNFYAGISYGRLLRSQVSVLKGYNLTDSVQQNLVNTNGLKSADFSFIIGVKRYFTNRVGLSVRHTNSLNLLYENPVPATITRGIILTRNYTSFRSYFVSFNVFYDFLTPKLVKKRMKK